MGNPRIKLTKHQFKKLKRKYKTAKDNGWKEFHFQGQEMLTDYAKYVIEHAEAQNPQWKK